MSTDKPTDPNPKLTDNEVDRLVYEALQREGRFVPQSPEEVAKAEAEITEAAVELPPGLRDPLALLKNIPTADSPVSQSIPPTVPPVDHTPAEPSSALSSPNRPKGQESPMRGIRARKMIAWLVIVGTIATVGGDQFFGWHMRARDVRDKELALQASQAELARIQEEDTAARKESRKDLDAALAAEADLHKLYLAAHESARKAIEEKDFVVRLTGPTHIQPGAPNKWQIETLRHGAIGRPTKLDVVVKDARDTELLRQTHDKPVGAATLELTPAFWTQVKPGSDLFLEVVAHMEDRKTVLAERLPLGRPVYITHLVTDKPLYKPGETIRFRSLTLDRSSLRPPEHDIHLKFRLLGPGDTEIPLGDGSEGNGRLLRNLQPVLGPDKKPLRGIGVGEYAIPADAPGGEYKLLLIEINTETGQETLLETRKFIVNRYVPDIFEKKLEFDGKSYGPGEFVQARIEVSRTAGGPMKNAKANVVAAADGKTFHEQKDASVVTVTNASGTRTILDVRFKLPADIFEKKDAPPNATLSVNIQDGSDSEAIVRPIPLVTKTLRVEFFPEGGEMIEGVPGRVYFMVRTPQGKPADLKGTITDGTNTLAEVSTLTDAENPGVNRGHGVFTLKPEPGKKYFLKLTSPLGITEPTKDGFPLPAAKADGVALTALDAVTKRGGSIRVRLQSPHGPKTLHVGAYVRERLIAQQRLVVEASKPADVTLGSDDSAGGVTRITVFEELKDDSNRIVLAPRAERLVFRASGEHLILNVNPDKLRYAPSGKVRIDLSALNEKKQPVPAVLLVAVVNRSVITMADNKTDRLMPTHFLLSGEVKHSSELEHADFLLTDHPKAGIALDLLLGTQGWRRFAEQDVASANLADKPDVEKLLVAHGQRPSAPLQLFKLEEQRVNAEFAPQLEQARLGVATAEAEWNATPSPVMPKLLEASTAVSVSESQLSEATWALKRFQSRFEKFGSWIAGVLVVALIAVGVFLTVGVAVSERNPKSTRRGRLVVAGVTTVVVCGLVVMLMTERQWEAKHFSLSMSFDESESMSNDLSLQGVRGGHQLDRPLFDPTIAQPAPTPPPTDPVKFNWFRTRSARPVIEKSELQADKTKVADAFRMPRRVDKTLQSMQGFDIASQDSGIMGEERRLPLVPPFVVREYAHQRDPALGEVRSDFTETVYWHPVLVLPESGKTTIEFQLSDDIARYQVLVAGHTLDGRIGAITTTIEARKPFSVDPKLPLEISHTDTVDVPIRVTNDSDVRRNVTITTTTDGFKTAGKLQDILDLAPNGKGRKILRLNADKLQGDAGLLIEGTSSTEKDAIARMIRIVPDGFPTVGSFSDMIEKGRARGTITLPKDLVPGTLKVRLEMYPTSMADLVSGLDGLLREPYGCFEQTSTTNYPNTLILDYMNQTNQTNPEAAKRAKDLLDKGYGRLTSFECPDSQRKIKHGFEWFGKEDMQHEALTAYGLLQFKDMARVHPVDPELIKRTQTFLLGRKDGKGGFHQNPRGLHAWVASKQVVDAYIVWALVESDPDDNEKMDLKLEIASLKAEALNENSTGGKDAYFVALVANVMLLRGEREAAHKLLDRLKDKHVKDGAVTGAVTSITQSSGRDLLIETTALALLGWLRANDPSYSSTIKESTRWISQQRGGYGGFGSTQSTILALKALTLHANKAKHPAEGGELQVRIGGKVIASRKFTEHDVDVIGLDIPNPETVFRPGEKTEVEIVTDAKQPYPFALAYTYTTLTPVSAEKCAVKIETKLAKTEASEGDMVPLHITL
ncbi:MAG: alpha-2-macroglobulin, partial [Planctomycetia bacterium]|nr:alpha-2-macroglobulin [Planctomycetia bacterium]